MDELRGVSELRVAFELLLHEIPNKAIVNAKGYQLQEGKVYSMALTS